MTRAGQEEHETTMCVCVGGVGGVANFQGGRSASNSLSEQQLSPSVHSVNSPMVLTSSAPLFLMSHPSLEHAAREKARAATPSVTAIARPTGVMVFFLVETLANQGTCGTHIVHPTRN